MVRNAAAATAGAPSAMPPQAKLADGPADGDTMRPPSAVDPITDPDFDLSSTFDVPAFLRRQEG